MGDKDKQDFTSRRVAEVSAETRARKGSDDPGPPDDPMTDRQAEHLRVLSEEANEPFDRSLTRAEADRRIDILQQRVGHRPEQGSIKGPTRS